MIFLILFIFIGIKLVSCCRKCTKDLEEDQEELTFAKVKSKCWFKVLVVLRMIVFVVCCAVGYYVSYGIDNGDKWADQAVESWDKHFSSFHHQHNINITLPQDCNAAFQSTLAENLVYIDNYSLGISDECLKNLSLDATGITSLAKSSGKASKYPVLVTAVSSVSFPEVLGLIENVKSNLRSTFFKPEIVIFDFGLSVEQHKSILQNCSFCDIRDYPSEQLIPCQRNKRLESSMIEQQRTKPFRRIYKPALIQLVLQNHDFVMWVDDSIRFSSISSFKKLVKGIKGKSIQIPMSDKTIAERNIDGEIFGLLHEEVCLFESQKALDSTIVLVRRNNFTLHAVMKPWVSTSFLYMSLPSRSKTRLPSKLRSDRKNNDTNIGFDIVDDEVDSSLLSIILSRLFSVDKQLFLFEFATLGWKSWEHLPLNETIAIGLNNTEVQHGLRNMDENLVSVGKSNNAQNENVHVVIEEIENKINNGTITYL